MPKAAGQKRMQRAKITQEELKEKDRTFLSLHIETPNSSILLLSEGEDQLGTLAAAVPQAQKMLGPPVSSILLGDRNTILSRMLAERLASKTGKIALTSVYLKATAEREAAPILIKLFDKTMKPDEEEKQKE
jgi:hypothetical protein